MPQNVKEIMKQYLQGNKDTCSLVVADNPIMDEIRDTDDILQMFTKYPLVPFLDGGGCATVKFLRKMRELSTTHGSCINSIKDFVFGGELDVIRKKEDGFRRFDMSSAKVNESQFNEYIDFIKSWTDGATLLHQMKSSYESGATWGNYGIEVTLDSVAGQPVAHIETHDADTFMYILKDGQQVTDDSTKYVAISPEFTLWYLDKYPPKVLPVFPMVMEQPDGSLKTFIHWKNQSVGRKWYGLPSWIQGLYHVYLDYQVGTYVTEGYGSRWIGEKFFETFGITNDKNGNPSFSKALIDTFTQKGTNRKRVMHRNAPQNGAATKIHEFKPNTNEKFDVAMSGLSENQVVKAHNWHSLLLGVKVSGQLGNSQEYREVFKRKYFTKIKPEQQNVLSGYRKAISLIEQWIGYDNPDNLTLSLGNVFTDMIEETNDALENTGSEGSENPENQFDE